MARVLLFIVSFLQVFSFILGLPTPNECDEEVLNEVQYFLGIINRSLSRFTENAHAMTIDTIYALILASEFLPNEFRQEHEIIEYLKDGFLRRDFGHHSFSQELIPLMLNTSLWRGVVKPLKDPLRIEYQNDLQNMPENQASNEGWEVDNCLYDLFQGGCTVQPDCRLYAPSLSGRGGTHIFLVLLTASQLGCENPAPGLFNSFWMQEIKENLCELAFLEMSDIFPKEKSMADKDVILEQITLCGLEGYPNFAGKIWRRLVMEWETDGCFGQEPPHLTEQHRRRKRNDSVDELGCHTHPTALGIAASSFFVNYLLQQCPS